MNLVFVASECAPWSKTGGLGDVMAALPKALARRGHRVMAVAPRYAEYAEGWETGVRITLNVFHTSVEVGFFHGFVDGVDVVFVDHPCYHGRSGGAIYGGDRTEVAFRCALLSKAAIEAARCVPCGGVPYGEDNLCFVANDWHAALVPVYLQDHYRAHGQFTYARAVLVIHNLAHQGRGPPGDADLYGVGGPLRAEFEMDDPVGGRHSNIMRAGIIAASRVVAVSHGYAWECQTMEGGWGLDGTLRDASWKFRGIVVSFLERRRNGEETEECGRAECAHASLSTSTLAHISLSLSLFPFFHTERHRLLRMVAPGGRLPGWRRLHQVRPRHPRLAGRQGRLQSRAPGGTGPPRQPGRPAPGLHRPAGPPEGGRPDHGLVRLADGGGRPAGDAGLRAGRPGGRPARDGGRPAGPVPGVGRLFGRDGPPHDGGRGHAPDAVPVRAVRPEPAVRDGKNGERRERERGEGRRACVRARSVFFCFILASRGERPAPPFLFFAHLPLSPYSALLLC